MQALERVWRSQDASTSSACAPDAACWQLLREAKPDLFALQWWGSPLQVSVSGGPEPPKKKNKHEKHDDYYANVGDAIRTLRDDYPRLFECDLNCALPSFVLCIPLRIGNIAH